LRKSTLLGLACLSSLCGAQEPAPRVAQCKRFVISQQEASRIPKRPFALDLQGSTGAHLVYIGVRHTFDSADPQWAGMKSAWDHLQPTVAFYEGTGAFVGDSAVGCTPELRRRAQPDAF
jgi:hypothetical protein